MHILFISRNGHYLSGIRRDFGFPFVPIKEQRFSTIGSSPRSKLGPEIEKDCEFKGIRES